MQCTQALEMTLAGRATHRFCGLSLDLQSGRANGLASELHGCSDLYSYTRTLDSTRPLAVPSDLSSESVDWFRDAWRPRATVSNSARTSLQALKHFKHVQGVSVMAHVLLTARAFVSDHECCGPEASWPSLPRGCLQAWGGWCSNNCELFVVFRGLGAACQLLHV